MENIMDYKGIEGKMVVSSRVRLARNLSKVPFPVKLDEERANDIIDKVFNSCREDESLNSLKDVRLIENKPQVIGCFFEKHLISKELIENFSKTAFLVNDDEDLSIMINDEDHIRIQSIAVGLDFKSTYDKCLQVDSALEEKLTYAFDENLGYLTANPRNVGTGIRGSVIIHLPAITEANQLSQVTKHLNDFGMIIKPVYMEDKKCMGNLYQISSEITIGMSEEDILIDLEEEVFKVMTKEFALRKVSLDKNRIAVLDKVYRSYALIRSAMIISLKEALDLISNVRLGVEMAIIKDVDVNVLDNLVMRIQPNNIKLLNDSKNFTDKQIDIERAKLIRDTLNENK